MSEADLKRSYKQLNRIAGQLKQGRLGWQEAWMTAGAILGYTGNTSIPIGVRKLTGNKAVLYPKNCGTINGSLRGAKALSAPEKNLLRLLMNIEKLRDADAVGTRMVDPHMKEGVDTIDRDYQEGKVLRMAEVGSVSKGEPLESYFMRKYRICIKGGLKDITSVNPQQKELVYAPGSCFKVARRQPDKAKAMLGVKETSEYIELVWMPRDSAVDKDFSEGKFSPTGDVL